MKDYILSGLRALDLTDEKGFACGKIMASLGIETIKIEKPGGDKSRKTSPTLTTNNGEEISLNWLAFNTDKLGITLDIDSPQGKEIFKRLVQKSDFVIESFMPGYLDRIGLGYEVLSEINPGIIMTSITPFGQKGPYANFKGSELIVSAMSGVMDSNGDPDRPPVREGPDSITFHSCAAAVLGSLIAYHYKVKTGEGQQVDVSMQEVAVTRTSSNLIVWEFDKKLIKRNSTIRTVGARSTRWIWECKDGYVFWAYMGGPGGAPANRAIAQWISEEGLDNPFKEITDWDEFDMASIPKEELDIQQEAISRLFNLHTKKELAQESLKRGLRISVIQNPADILEDIQLESRDYWSYLEHPELGLKLRYPKYFFLSNLTENFIRKRAPYPGEDNEYVYCNILGLTKSELEILRREKII